MQIKKGDTVIPLNFLISLLLSISQKEKGKHDELENKEEHSFDILFKILISESTIAKPGCL